MSSDKFDKFTKRARRVLTFAQEEAQLLKHNYIGTEHLLLGLVREEDGLAGKVLRDLGLQYAAVRQTIEDSVGPGQAAMGTRLSLTPRTKRVIELSVDEARRMGHHYIGTEHLLLGLIREGDGIAVNVLNHLGFRPDQVRSNLARELMNASVEVEDTALSEEIVMERRVIATEHAPQAIGPYSQAIRSGNLVFCAGQIPLDPASGKLVEGGIREQTRRVLESLSAVLTAADSSLNRVVKTTVFLANLDDFKAMNETYAEFFAGTPPARSTVQVARLPAGALVEIEAIALVNE